MIKNTGLLLEVPTPTSAFTGRAGLALLPMYLCSCEACKTCEACVLLGTLTEPELRKFCKDLSPKNSSFSWHVTLSAHHQSPFLPTVFVLQFVSYVNFENELRVEVPFECCVPQNQVLLRTINRSCQWTDLRRWHLFLAFAAASCASARMSINTTTKTHGCARSTAQESHEQGRITV